MDAWMRLWQVINHVMEHDVGFLQKAPDAADPGPARGNKRGLKKWNGYARV